MWALQFFVYALMVFLLTLLFGGTMIGYYFQKKYEYEMKKLVAVGKAITSAGNGARDGHENWPATDEKS